MSKPVAKYQKYAQYKDSGVEWLGEIPLEWSIASIARVSNKITNGYVGATRDIFYDSGVRYLQSLHIKKNKINFHTPYYVSEDWSNEKSKSILKEGDVLIVQTGDIGQVAAVTREFEGCNCHALIIVSGNEKIWGFYLSWLLNSDYGRQTLKSIQTGALHPHLNCDAIKDVKITLPDIQIQKNISNFLDHETAKIDTLIAKQEKLIELLKEKRQAVISHAVTKGLNPDVTMKDSGVEWLGQVPEHWHTTRIKYVAELTPKKSEVLNTDNSLCTFVPMEKLKLGRLVKDDEKPISEVIGGYTYFKDGDLLLAKVTPCFENKNMVVASGLKNGIGFGSSEIYVLRTNNSISNQFLYYRLQDEQFIELGTGAMTGAGGLKRVPSEFLNNFIFALPPLEEQFTIAEYLDRYLLKSEYLMNQAKSAIQLMKERRTALISAAVTGKIDVRNWQNPNQNNNQNNMELSA